VRCLTKTQNSIHIGDIEVDRDALFSITYKCVPGLCKKTQCCCSKYEIVADRNEIDRIIGYMPAASRYAPHLGNGHSLDNVFEEDKEDGVYVVDTDEDGLCVFAYRHRRHGILCSLHSAALELKLPHYRTKPRSCVLWPLAITEDLPLQLSIADDAFDFPCNTRRKSPGKSLDPNIAQTIQDLFGPGILKRINEANR